MQIETARSNPYSMAMPLQDPNWVAERAKCDINQLWADVKTLAGSAVARMNAEAGQRVWPDSYSPPEELSGQEGVQITRFKDNRERGKCCLRLNGRQVIATTTHPSRHVSLTTRWDAAESQCRVVVEIHAAADPQTVEFPHDQLWKAVQYLLEPFFFPPPK